MSTSDKRTAAFAVLDSSGNPTGEIVAAGKSVIAVTAKTSLDGGIGISDGCDTRSLVTAGVSGGVLTGNFT